MVKVIEPIENTSDQPTSKVALIPKKETCKLRSRSPSSLDNDIRAGYCTRPIKNGPKLNFWPLHEIEILVAAEIAGKSKQEIKELVASLEAGRAKLFDSLVNQYQVVA